MATIRHVVAIAVVSLVFISASVGATPAIQSTETNRTAQTDTVSITGNVYGPNGTPMHQSIIFVVNENGYSAWDEVGKSGNFTVNASASEPVFIVFYQFNTNHSKLLFPNDTVPDVFTFFKRSFTSDTDLGSLSLPRAYDVRIRANELFDTDSAPEYATDDLEFELIDYAPRADSGWGLYNLPATDRGLASINNSGVVFDLVGEINMNISAFNSTYYDGGGSTEVTVDKPTSVTLSLYVNEPPVVVLSISNRSPTVGQRISLNVYGSSDPDGSIDTARWDFNSDGRTDARGLSVAHIFWENGSHTVTATVADGAGRTNTSRVTVNVTGTAAKPIGPAIAGSDRKLSLGELQTAITYWSNQTPVPDTNGKTIGLAKLQSLIQAWANGETV